MPERHEALTKLRRSYTKAYKLKILRAVEEQGLQAVAETTSISKETIRKWDEAALASLQSKAKRSPGAGRPYETGIYYDTPPRYLWTQIGQDSSLDASEKSSARLTAVLSARSNGEKLPILFIIKGEKGGFIEQNELQEYPQEHLYFVQKNAWMDADGWKYYLTQLMSSELRGPTLFVVDNFNAHVSDASFAMVEEELSSFLCPLPKNCTTVLQTLDVGVMGQFKSILRRMWLSETTTQRTAKQKRMVTIKRAIAAWNAITAETIISSFRKALPKID
ncbi:hypothetical protein AeRB84_020829 [Aphanomyces euteiches]|nr:hypothetical protein AeRB84_020829 [Aphanomyces euteiches]